MLKDATLVRPNTEKYLENPVFGSFRVHLVQFDFGKYIFTKIWYYLKSRFPYFINLEKFEFGKFCSKDSK